MDKTTTEFHFDIIKESLCKLSSGQKSDSSWTHPVLLNPKERQSIYEDTIGRITLLQSEIQDLRQELSLVKSRCPHYMSWEENGCWFEDCQYGMMSDDRKCSCYDVDDE